MSIGRTDPIIGKTLGDFLVKEKLGEGGFGAVYKARQITLDREAVIKILHTRHRTNQTIIERFKREAHLASRLEHPYCAHIYSFGAESDGLLWIAMEYVQGTPLNEILRVQGALPLEKFVPLLDKICEVVHTAHEAGIIHRDLKPANVMVISRAGRLLPKLLDFGIAKGLSIVSSSNGSLAKMGFVEDCSSTNTPDKSEFSGEDTVVIPSNLERKTSNIASGQNTFIESHFNNIVEGVQNSFSSTETPNSYETLIQSEVIQGQVTVVDGSIFNGKETVVEEEHINGNQNGVGKRTDPNKPLLTDLKDLFSITKGEVTLKTHGFIGSPPYMPPEQWQNGAKVDVRSDIYSLGITAYQVIVGELPFTEQGFDLYGAHSSKPIPLLTTSFPIQLNQVLQKALAKKPEDRYQTALDFAKNFRLAANFDEEKVNLPQLDDILRENLLANAPKPLADTISSLFASHNTYQFRDRVLLVFRVLVRYLGILAIAGYASFINKQEGNELINKSITNLCHEGLSEFQWMELTRELCRPFAKRRDTHPIPELVSLFFTNDNEQLGPLVEHFSKLLEIQQEIISTVSLKEDLLLNLLGSFLRKLETFLRATVWLSDYQLVLPLGDHATKVMGITKDVVTVTLKSNNLTWQKAVLVDSRGGFVLSLWPLVEVTAPVPGTAAEVFLIARKGRSGIKMVSFPEGFEIESDNSLDWLKEHFFTGDEKSQTGLLLEKSPYLGLSAFLPTDASLFVGREKETESFLNRLRMQSLLVVIGSSGAGKSSFVQAGVVAALGNKWEVITVRPGLSPLITLSTRLLKIGIELNDLRTILQKDVNFLAKALRRFAAEQNKMFLLVIDQFEEVMTLCPDKQEQSLYAEALAAVARSEDDPIRVVLTMRDDFLVRAKELKGLTDRLNQSLEILTVPNSTQLLRILTEPARRAGYEFEDSNLPIEIINELTGQLSALPLLAFTSAKLWEHRDKQFKLLKRKPYESMGGVSGALVQHAEEMMLQIPQSEQSLVREAFRHLITSDGVRTVLTYPELSQLLGNTSHSKAVIERLISARLLVTTEGEKGIDRIEIVHDTLLSTWPRLVKWQQEDKEGARLRDQLRSAARQWQERNRPNGLLWRDEALAEYQIWRSYHKSKLTNVEEEFTKASILEATRNQRIKRTLATIAMIVLLVGSTVMAYQRYETKQQLLKTLELFEEQGRQEMLKGNIDGAAIYLSEAYTKGSEGLALRYMLSVALAKIEGQPSVTLASHTGAITMATFSPDDSLVATASKDKTARIWQAIDGKELFNLKGHEGAITFVNFSFDGRLLVTSSQDKTAKIWQVSDGKLIATLSGHTGTVQKALFSPDGNQIVTISDDYNGKLWDKSGKFIATLEGHSNSINDVAYNKDSSKIATVSSDKTVKIWDAKTGALIATLSGHKSPVITVAFSPDGRLLVTGSVDKTAKIWQVIDEKLLSTLEGHLAAVTDTKFSFDGNSILTTSADAKGRLWDVKTGALVSVLDSHTADITSGAFSSDNKLIVTTSLDKTLRVWERSSGKFLFALAENEGGLNKGMFSNKGENILVAGENKTAKIWPLMAEDRPYFQVKKIVEDKVPFYLSEGRLVAKNSQTQSLANNTESEIKKTEDASNNLYVEDLGNGIKLEMVKIEGGTFEMGSPVSEKEHGGDELQHQVTLSGFYMGKYEITQAQWKAVASLPRINLVLSADPSQLSSNPLKFKGDALPITNMNWYEVVEFCERLSKLTGKNYRLPTESEWEYACRAGTKEATYGNLDEIAWYFKNSGDKPHPVGQKKPNAFGLYDMIGNVWEFCSDWYGEYPKEPVINSKGSPNGTSKVLRGGYWFSNNCRSADRASYPPDAGHFDGGMRIVLVKE